MCVICELLVSSIVFHFVGWGEHSSTSFVVQYTDFDVEVGG